MLAHSAASVVAESGELGGDLLFELRIAMMRGFRSLASTAAKNARARSMSCATLARPRAEGRPPAPQARAAAHGRRA